MTLLNNAPYYSLITNDIEGANPKKFESGMRPRNIMATHDIDGAVPNPYYIHSTLKHLKKQNKIRDTINKSVSNGTK